VFKHTHMHGCAHPENGTTGKESLSALTLCKVRVNDQIVLESFLGKNFLHVSARRFDDSFIENGHNGQCWR
jgi:hypothetical protein